MTTMAENGVVQAPHDALGSQLGSQVTPVDDYPTLQDLWSIDARSLKPTSAPLFSQALLTVEQLTQVKVDADIQSSVNEFLKGLTTQMFARIVRNGSDEVGSWLGAKIQGERDGWLTMLRMAMEEIEFNRKQALQAHGLLQDTLDQLRLLVDCFQLEEEARCDVMSDDVTKAVQACVHVIAQCCNTLMEDRFRCVDILGCGDSAPDSVSIVVQQLKDRLDQLSAEKDAMVNQHEDTNNENSKLRKQNDHLMEQVQKMGERVRCKQHDLESLKSQLREIDQCVKQRKTTSAEKCVGTGLDLFHPGLGKRPQEARTLRHSEQEQAKTQTHIDGQARTQIHNDQRQDKTQIHDEQRQDRYQADGQSKTQANTDGQTRTQSQSDGHASRSQNHSDQGGQTRRGQQTSCCDSCGNVRNSQEHALLTSRETMQRPSHPLREPSFIELSEEKLRVLKERARKLETSLHGALASMDRVRSKDGTCYTSVGGSKPSTTTRMLPPTPGGSGSSHTTATFVTLPPQRGSVQESVTSWVTASFQVGNQTGTAVTTVAVPRLGHFKPTGVERRCFSERPPGKVPEEESRQEKGHNAIPSITGGRRSRRGERSVSVSASQSKNGVSYAKNGVISVSQARNGVGVVQAKNGVGVVQAKNGIGVSQAKNGIGGSQAKNDVSVNQVNNETEAVSSENLTSRNNRNETAVTHLASQPRESYETVKLLQSTSPPRGAEIVTRGSLSMNESPHRDSPHRNSTPRDSTHRDSAQGVSNPAQASQLISNHHSQQGEGTEPVAEHSNGTDLAQHSNGNHSSPGGGGGGDTNGTKTGRGSWTDSRRANRGKANQVSKCLRCQKLFTCTDNHKLACCFHSKGKERVEVYTEGGQLLKVHYMWRCCQQTGDTDGCCYGHHV